jgi:copper chaperone
MLKLKIIGMTCGHCEAAVKKALEAVPGVDEVLRVDRVANEALIAGSPDPAALIAAVVEEGYTVEAT